MKKISLSTLLVIVCTIIFAQNYYPFPSSNTIWNNHLYVSSGATMDISSITRLGIFGDTIFNELNYHKLYLIENDTIINLNKMTYYAAIRENNNQVFVKLIENNYEILVYDFGLDIGDTIISNATSGYLANNTNVILNIDSVQVNDNSYRKRFKISNNEYWIEGIGSIGGLLFPITDVNSVYLNYWPILACLKQNNEAVYLYYQTDVCFIQQATKIEYNETQSKLKIYPNPTINTIMIESELAPSLLTVKVFNSYGDLKKTETFNSFPIKINMSNLSSGIYLIQVTTGEGIYNEKIIKN